MSISKDHSWKILCLEQNQTIANEAEKNLHDAGYTNTKFIVIENEKTSDDKVIELLKEGHWDAVTFTSEFTCRETTILHWFNRLVNFVLEYSPKSKVIFITNLTDLIDSFVRVLDSQEKPIDTV